MKYSSFLKIPVLVVLVFSCVGISAQSPVDSTRVLRILTYNILHGETMQGDFDLDQIARVIKSADPDLVALQEVDFFTRRAKHMDLATELGQRTGLAPLFGKAMPYDGGEYGEGILSRYSFLSTRNHALPAGEGKEPRAALEAHVVLQSGDTIVFVGTHFDHTGEADRIRQASRVNELLADRDMPILLAGDLNARPDSKTMEVLFSEWTPSAGEFDPTFPSLGPRVKIDYVLYRPANRWRVIEIRVICDSIASDHCAQLSLLELLPAGD
jgi:endonuclease/exonuclease/phosphatase family metal-dependent hydrolase